MLNKLLYDVYDYKVLPSFVNSRFFMVHVTDYILLLLQKFSSSMWAEDDFEWSSGPCLESSTEPTDGKTYTMYHGTSREAAKKIKANGFSQSSGGMLGRGVYVSRDLKKASRYPLELPEHERVVLKLRVNVGRVKKIDYQGHPMQKTWHTEHGYDTAWVPRNCGMVKSGLEEDCVWDPKHITITDTIYQQAGASGGTSVERKSRHRQSGLDLSNRKVVVKNADMSVEMQLDSVECATQAMEMYNIEKDIAAYIKKTFDKKYNPAWHCIVGRNFGSYVSPDKDHFIYFYLGHFAILLFKTTDTT
ncbi:hypothetical protein JZ751_013501 [Albula glossodonta]|uniref:PARP catalytic domain-containing protein n=1 Tax=Albula glossodonta TaxID=121402 RepID=A0A8T2N5J2_9TELE|nr:hypothetical protein JZ751_013501 [Albula glossodonta]